jgi:cysteine desulfurase/selenocysteine lyase
VIHPIDEICRRAAERGIPVLVDAAQSVGHLPVDVANLKCDFLAFSAHKMFGPTGIGALYARPQHLEAMEPLLLGGGMVDVVGEVGEAGSEWLPYPQKFEAGSPNLAGAVGFAAAVNYIKQTGLAAMQAHVGALTRKLIEALRAIDGVILYGPGDTDVPSGIVSFNLAGVHPHDLGQIAGEQSVALRAGHHCSQPLMRFLGTQATARVSLAPYNTADDIQALVRAIHAAQRVFA